MGRQTNDRDAESARAAARQPRIVIDQCSPCVDGGRYPARAVIGQPVVAAAVIFMDGHATLRAELRWQSTADADWHCVPMRRLENDRWDALLSPNVTGLHRFTISAWLDRWSTYCDELGKKYRAGVPVALEIREGLALLQAASARDHAVAAELDEQLRSLADASEQDAVRILLAPHTAELMHHLDVRPFAAVSDTFFIEVERVAAGFASWYELFPRSQSHSAEVHGTFDDVIARLPALHAMGFDVLYFPPIHPIGMTHRKGRNNSVQAQPGDPGSPYAIGSEAGGFDAIHSQLGGLEAFQRLRTEAAAYGMELAMDFAIQCSPDHPWLRQHPGWFDWRPDGSIKYAENPPKIYQDIVNVDFYTPEAIPGLWLALRDVVLYWVGQGVHTFRVDNPHTKPLPFWEWMIRDVRARHPQTLFLSEAFTRPAMMYRLAKVGFTQSYSYFIWRESRQEFTDYLNELANGPPRDFFRPNFFVNTPDINPLFLQTSGRAGFMIRAALAATLSGLWGIYSGFELCEAAPLPGKEEYLDSEKYQLKPRDWTAEGNIIGVITRLNRIRRENAALQTHLGVSFHPAGNDRVLFFSKMTPDRSNVLLVAISLDPVAQQDCQLALPRQALGLAETATVEVEELMRGERVSWATDLQHWRLDSADLPFAVFRLRLPGALA